MGTYSELPIELPQFQDRIGSPAFELSPGNAGQGKLSARLVEVARLLVGDDSEPEEWRTGISLAAIAWNLALLPQEMRDTEMRELLDLLREKSGIEPDLLSDLLGQLVKRKRLLYPDDQRTVLKWQVRTSRRRVHVIAMGSAPRGPI